MNIIVIDDDRLVAASLKTILESTGRITVDAVGNSGLQAIELYDKHLPDVLLMDIRMEGMTGIEAAKKILSIHKDAKILFLTTFSDYDYIAQALSAGAKGYILKQNYESIAPSLTAVYNGQNVFGDEIVGKLNNSIKPHSDFHYENYEISEREQAIIKLIADGLSNKEIADTLYLSEGTVRNYLSGILDKLSLRDRTQLAVFYYKNIQ
ncbi:MAG: response regulator transcription factor [Oscillospiraceae bacterium]|nr:response regulator transcription factor [Oscillospiraceae bacterium]